jgi:hypothetical protein
VIVTGSHGMDNVREKNRGQDFELFG